MSQISTTTYPLSPCTKKEYGDLLTFLDKCFNKKTPHWFTSNMGHIFQPKPKAIAQHLIYKQNGTIKGAIGIYPYELCIGKAVLKVAGVGSVSVSPRLRCRGLMASMLLQVNEIIKSIGFDISCLDGDRYRYRNYGWDLGGKRYHLFLCRKDISRLAQRSPTTLKTTILTRKDIPDLINLYNLFPNRVQRDYGTFHLHLRRKNLKWLGGYSPKGMAYLAYDINNRSKIIELQGDPDTALVLLEWFANKFSTNTLRLNHSVTTDRVSLMLQHAATHLSVHNASQVQILDHQSTLKKLKPEIINSSFDKKQCRETLKKATHNEQTAILKKAMGFTSENCQTSEKLALIASLPWWISDADRI